MLEFIVDLFLIVAAFSFMVSNAVSTYTKYQDWKRKRDKDVELPSATQAAVNQWAFTKKRSEEERI